ncbi:hypothetical protein [Anaerophilus nitritogenes]|uniref:hypothetical protein n=1 Tax=Anaerophilus nitritogenes TaxID=2498136 RepID=UPI00101D2CA6|nr:hypothetical protein [Anaerophilus nitritogenes]
MKKYIVYPIIFILLFCSCANKKEYIKEFPYLPQYENLKITDFEEAKDKNGLNHSNFSVKNVQFENFLSDYEKILRDHNWKTIDDKKPFSIQVQKDDHFAIIVITSQQKDKDIKGIIYAK